jgi:hypothetical protein
VASGLRYQGFCAPVNGRGVLAHSSWAFLKCDFLEEIRANIGFLVSSHFQHPIKFIRYFPRSYEQCEAVRGAKSSVSKLDGGPCRRSFCPPCFDLISKVADSLTAVSRFGLLHKRACLIVPYVEYYSVRPMNTATKSLPCRLNVSVRACEPVWGTSPTPACKDGNKMQTISTYIQPNS